MKKNFTEAKTTSTCCLNTTSVLISALSAQPPHRTSRVEKKIITNQNRVMDTLTLSLGACLCCAGQPGAACIVCATGNTLKRVNAVKPLLNYQNRPTNIEETFKPAYSTSGVLNTLVCCWNACTAPSAISALCDSSVQNVPYVLPLTANSASMIANLANHSPMTTTPEAIVHPIKGASLNLC